MSLALALILIGSALVLLAIGGLLTAADAALAVRSRAELEELAARAPRSGQAISKIAADEPAHVGALRFARVFTESLAAVLITLVLAYTIPTLWASLVVAAIVISLISFVVVGSSPRSVGSSHPEGILMFAAPTLRAVRIVLGPIATVLMRVGDRVTPGSGSGRGRINDEQQLLSMVDQAAEQAVLEEDDREYIHSLVEFGDTLVREVMRPRIDMVTVESDASIREALDELLSSRHSRVPVIAGESDDVLGVAYLRDASAEVLRRPEEAEVAASVRRIMKPAMFVPEVQEADQLLRHMQLQSNHLALVVDEYGGISGLVTLEDLIEELVGDIADEHDRDEAEIVAAPDGSYLVSARLSVEELGELFHVDLEDDEVDTVGGLVAKLLGRLPEPGDTVELPEIELKAVEVERKFQRLVTVRARQAAANPEPMEQS